MPNEIAGAAAYPDAFDSPRQLWAEQTQQLERLNRGKELKFLGRDGD
jgi:hypothetical protein